MSVRHIRQLLRTVFAIERRADTGILDVRGETDRALLYFRGGRLVFVEQSNLGRTIGAYLVDNLVVSREQYQTLVAAVANDPGPSPLLTFMERAIGEGLIEHGVANAILSSQVERNFIRTLGWDADYCRFSPETQVLVGQPVFPCSLQVLVLQGLRAHLGEGERAELLGRYGSRLPRLGSAPGDLAREFRLQPREERFLRELDHFTPLAEQLPDPSGGELCLIIALHFSGRLSFSRSERSTSSAKVPIIDERPRGERLTENKIRLTLPQPPSEEEVLAAAAFHRGKRSLHDDPRAALDELHTAANMVPRPDYVLYATWADYACADADAKRGMLSRLEDATRRALEADGTLAFAYFVVGHLHLALGDPQSATLAFERSQALDPTDPSPAFELAAIKEGRYGTA